MSESTKDELTKRMALFRDQKYGSVLSFDLHGKDESYTPSIGEYVRITEWMTVTFKPLSASDVTGAELMALSKFREKTVNEFKEKLDFIDGRIANLRALTGPTGAA